MTSARPRLHVCGFSARAAVQAAVGLELECEGWDCFGDRDAVELAPWNRIGGLRSRDLSELFKRPPGILLPCGGLENRGSLWARLSERHRVIGPDPRQLRKLRDPRWLSRFCDRPGFRVRFPASCFDRREFENWLRSTGDSWQDRVCLVKRRRSGGGGGVRRLCVDDRAALANPTIRRGEYLQRFVAGDEYSAVLRCGAEPKLLFASRPWPRAEAAAPPFLYRGSIGPAALPPRATAACLAFARELGAASGCAGVLQIDLIVSADDEQPYLLEVNPRWTGSMELAELLRPGSVLGEMLLCDAEHGPWHRDGRVFDAGVVAAKAILYAESDIVVDERLSAAMLSSARPPGFPSADNSRGGGRRQASCWLADVPIAGATAAPHAPICTVIGVGPTDEVLSEVRLTLDRWRAVICGAKNQSASETI